MFKSPYIDGIRYLLVTGDGNDYVQRYTIGECHQLFTADQLNTLDKGETISTRGGAYTDMVVAARAPLIA